MLRSLESHTERAGVSRCWMLETVKRQHRDSHQHLNDVGYEQWMEEGQCDPRHVPHCWEEEPALPFPFHLTLSLPL